MTLNHRQPADIWVDDHLDLYNYAVQIGDVEWQRSILAALRSNETSVRELNDHLAVQELRTRFDAINRKMLEIYEQLKRNRNASNEDRLREKVWELKQQRGQIASKLRARTHNGNASTPF